MTTRKSARRSSRNRLISNKTEPCLPYPSQHQKNPGKESRLIPAPRYQAESYKAAGKLQGKIAVVTGGDSGIGRAVAILFAREGADVAISFLPEERDDAEITKTHIENFGQKCLLLPGDITRPAQCLKIIEQTVKKLGGIDILVSNAAHQTRHQNLEKLTDKDIDKTFQTNIYAYFRLARAALRYMYPGAAIVATSSETGIFGSEKLHDYSATKGAINAFTKSLAVALIPRGIRVNAVAPGPVWTPLNPSDRGLSAKQVATFGSKNPIGRPAQPEELAPAYVFLASNADSSYITGTVLQVMGGETSGG